MQAAAGDGHLWKGQSIRLLRPTSSPCLLRLPYGVRTSRGAWTRSLTRGLVGARQPTGVWTAFTDIGCSRRPRPTT